jgi:hypothetical protein
VRFSEKYVKKPKTYSKVTYGRMTENKMENVAGIHQLMGIMGFQASHLENFSHYCPNIIQN